MILKDLEFLKNPESRSKTLESWINLHDPYITLAILQIKTRY